MFGVIAVERFKFGATCTLLGYPVRVSTAHTGRSHRFVRIDHYAVLSSGFGYIVIVVYHPLSVVVFAARNDRSYITCFYCIITIVVHKAESLVQVTFVIHYRGGRFVVHNQFYTFGSGVLA